MCKTFPLLGKHELWLSACLIRISYSIRVSKHSVHIIIKLRLIKLFNLRCENNVCTLTGVVHKLYEGSETHLCMSTLKYYVNNSNAARIYIGPEFIV